jgi:hypothetical protein
MTTAFTYLVAYILACIAGWLAVACALYVMRRLVLKEKNRPPFIDWISFFGGATERAVALTLVLKAPPYLPAFIGGWVLLKFAIGWQREKRDDDDEKEVATQSFLALIGSVLSFAIAIAIGLALNPKALDVWATTPR